MGSDTLSGFRFSWVSLVHIITMGCTDRCPCWARITNATRWSWFTCCSFVSLVSFKTRTWRTRGTLTARGTYREKFLTIIVSAPSPQLYVIKVDLAAMCCDYLIYVGLVQARTKRQQWKFFPISLHGWKLLKCPEKWKCNKIKSSRTATKWTSWSSRNSMCLITFGSCHSRESTFTFAPFSADSLFTGTTRRTRRSRWTRTPLFSSWTMGTRRPTGTRRTLLPNASWGDERRWRVGVLFLLL